MLGFCVVRRPPAFGDDVSVTHKHKAVKRVCFAVGFVDELQNGLGGDALRFWRAARKRWRLGKA